jgi:hypothetical protein
MELLSQPVRIKKGYLLYILLFIGYVSSADCVPETKLPLVNSLAELQAILLHENEHPEGTHGSRFHHDIFR